MKKLLVSLILFCCFCSCEAPKMILKGNYQETPYSVETSKSLEEVWSNIIDLFSTHGISIKIIDKSSGLITSDHTSFLNNYTYEDEYGKPINPNAYVVIYKLKNGFGTPLPPDYIEGDWNIRIKNIDGKTIINVNLVNLRSTFTTQASRYGPSSIINIPVKSTGVFEKVIAESIR